MDYQKQSIILIALSILIGSIFNSLSDGGIPWVAEPIKIVNNSEDALDILAEPSIREVGIETAKALQKGYFVKPTVFADVNNNMEIARTEIFGPVLSVMPFENEEEAIQIANDTPYGLTNYIQTQDKEKVKRVARKLRSGMVDVNGAGIAVDAPFGGFKHSGIGREAGEHGLEEFLEVKSVGGWNN